MKIVFKLTVFLSFSLAVSLAEIYSAFTHTERLLSIELDMANVLEDYIMAEENKLHKLKEFSRKLQKTVQMAKSTGSKFLENPVNSYLMIKRFVSQWPAIEEIVSRENPAEGVLLDQFMMHKSKFPEYSDVSGAVTAIQRLQDVYDLLPSNFSEGSFGHHSSSYEYLLGPIDTYSIGRHSYQNSDFESTRDWMSETLRLMDLGVHNDTEYPERKDVLDHLAFAEFKTDDVESAVKHEIEAYKLDPNNTRIKNNVMIFGEILEENKQKYKEIKDKKKTKIAPDYRYLRSKIPQDVLANFNWFVEKDIYKRLCRGEKLPMMPQDVNKLKCWYFTNSPLCKIKRCAMERVFTSPDIRLLKTIITDSEIKQVRAISEPLLNRARVHNPQTGVLETASYRVSKNCWLTGQEHGEVIERIENRIAAMTRLDLATAEGFQVQNYGLAGQYDPHFDFSRNLSHSSLGQLGTGNRLATVLVYMSQVEAGGATVFPYLGLRVLPQKGDAVFWHNLRPSGEGDFRTRHAGCPVLSGIKWVANKWIHEYGNEFTRPCSLQPDDE